jgi:hypothetical protein
MHETAVKHTGCQKSVILMEVDNHARIHGIVMKVEIEYHLTEINTRAQ